MDAQRFEALAAAIDRGRRTDFWLSLVAALIAVGVFAFLQLVHVSAEREQLELLRSALASNDSLAAGTVLQVINNSAWSTSLSFGSLMLIVLIPWALGRYRRRHDQALVELLRAQSKSQASSP